MSTTTTLPPLYDDPPVMVDSSTAAPSTFEMLLPPQSLVLVILLLLIVPLALLTGESLLVPLIEAVRDLMAMPDLNSFKVALPLHFYIKLGVFLLLMFFGVIQLFFRVRQIYTQTWSRRFPRPDPLHVDYQPDFRRSMLSMLNWYIYRTLAMGVPPLVFAVLTVVLAVIELYCFNVFVNVPPVVMPLMVIGFLFALFMVGALTVALAIKSLWMGITTVFGDIVAMTEPDLPARTILERCQRIAFSSPYIYLLYIAYAAMTVVLLAGVALLVTAYDIEDIIQFRFQFLTVLGLETAMLAVLLGVGYLKLMTYHDALGQYYRGLPPAFRARFSPPPASMPLDDQAMPDFA